MYRSLANTERQPRGVQEPLALGCKWSLDWEASYNCWRKGLPWDVEAFARRGVVPALWTSGMALSPGLQAAPPGFLGPSSWVRSPQGQGRCTLQSASRPTQASTKLADLLLGLRGGQSLDVLSAPSLSACRHARPLLLPDRAGGESKKRGLRLFSGQHPAGS